MREIIFRGRRKSGGEEWLYGDLNQIGGSVFRFSRTEDTGNDIFGCTRK